MTEQVKEMRVTKALEAALPGVITGGKYELNELTLEIDAARILAACEFLRRKDRFIRLASVTGVDWYPMEPRFEVVYHLHSMPRPGITEDERLRLKVKVGGDKPELESVCSVWPCADWHEREIFDLFGIGFLNHPNLTRILMPDDWQGHPLRKDYPVHGYKYSYKSE